MVKCPFCGFDNEDGALFCEQCKSDLSSVAPAASAPPPPPPPEAMPFAPVEENVPMAAVMEASPDDIPMAALESGTPMAVVEATPMEDDVPMAVAEDLSTLPDDLPTAPVGQTPPALPPPPEPAPAPPPPAPVAAAPVADPAPAAAPAAAAGKAIPANSDPKLVVIRGQKLNVEFPIYAGQNFIGRADDKPVDIDLEDQEPPERVWTSRQHAVLEWEGSSGTLTLEDLNSSNGTYVNRDRAYPGQKRQLYLGDVVQIGTIHMRVSV